jgi:carboxypeptidase family protein/TonB-dependent receptor-like protein
MIHFRSNLVLMMLVASVIAARPALGQLAALRGRVTETVTDEPLPGASVVLKDSDGRQTGTVTGAGGDYLMTRLRPGTYILTVSFVGFESRTDTLEFGFDEVIVYDISLTESEGQLAELLVEENRSVETRSTAGLEVVRPSALARVPMPDVSYDLAGYLLTLPGFVSPGDRGGQLFVRGGTSTQNLVLVDGIPIFQPFHIIGFYSAFPADIISFADVYAGGFGARYGGRISSVIDVTTTNGNKGRATGGASFAPFVSSVRFELPVEPGKVSLVGSVRESIIEQVSPTLLGKKLPFRFGDRFLKLHAFLNQTSSLSITGIQTFDQGDLGSSGQERPSTWRNDAVGFRYTFLPPEQAVLSQMAMHYSKMESSYEPAPDIEQKADVDAFTMEILIAYLLGKSQVRIGLFGNLNNFRYRLGPRQREFHVGVTSGGGYIDTQFELGSSLRLEPGVRYEVFSRGIKGALDPRIRALWLPFGGGSRQQWSVALGRYHQQIIGLNNEQDVSDVFTIWAPSPGNDPVPEAIHVIVGVQQRLTRWLEVSVEAYNKTFKNLAFPVFDDRPNALTGFSKVQGRARGMDFRAEVTRRSLYGRIAYTLAEVEYEWSEPGSTPIRGVETTESSQSGTFRPPHDRRHQVNASLQISRDNTRLSVGWQLGSGLPFTQINGFYRDLRVDLGDPPSHLQSGGDTVVSRGPAFGARLPAYHRLDVSVEHDFVSTVAVTTVHGGVINAYDRQNILEYNFFSGERVNQLPLVPSFGIAVKLR